ncbi:MAG TPA: hypothetical protein VGJ13_20500 [Pseudonocardiaceae bacterium]
MTAERISVTLPPDVLSDARCAVAAGAAESMSAFVASAMRTKLRRDHDLAELERIFGGPPPPEVLDAVRRDLGLPPAPMP